MVDKKDYIAKNFSKMWSNIISDLREKNGCIIVEGKHDKDVLLMLNVPQSRIVIIGSRKLDDVSEYVSQNFELAYLFLDKDFRGRLKEFFLRKKLANSIPVLSIWEYLFQRLGKFGFKSIRKVEEFRSLAMLIHEKEHSFIRSLRKKFCIKF